jgi:hypothetical protein
MKFRSVCMECFRIAGTPSDDLIEIELVDGPLVGRCSAGHETPLAIQEQDFELLFDFGCMALLDGYTREAVSSMAVALERMHLFYIRCIFSHCRRATPALPVGLEDSFLSKVSRQSERQIGAFFALYALNEHEEPPLLANKWIEFRNNCIHKGHIPSREKVLTYATEVVRIMDTIVTVLRSKYPDAVRLQIGKYLRARHVPGKLGGTLHVPTVVSLVIERPSTRSFDERLQELDKWRRGLWVS